MQSKEKEPTPSYQDITSNLVSIEVKSTIKIEDNLHNLIGKIQEHHKNEDTGKIRRT